MSELEKLTQAAAKAQRDLQQAAAQAVRDNVSITEVAQQCGVTRQTVYRWLDRQPGTAIAEVDVREVLDDGLALLMNLTTPGSVTARDLVVGLQSSQIDVKVRRWEWGVKRLEQTPDQQCRTVMARVHAVVDRVKHVQREHSRWPDKVSL